MKPGERKKGAGFDTPSVTTILPSTWFFQRELGSARGRVKGLHSSPASCLTLYPFTRDVISAGYPPL